MIRTFGTRIRKSESPMGVALLPAFAELMCRAERKIHTFVRGGGVWEASHYAPVYKELGLSAALFRMAKDSLDGKLDSVWELTKLNIASLERKVSAKEKQIKSKEAAREKNRTKLAKLDGDIAALDERIHNQRLKLETAKSAKKDKALLGLKKLLDKVCEKRGQTKKLAADIKAAKHALHQHKRRLGNLKEKLAKGRARLGGPSLAFGSKKLFKKQFNLTANGYASHSHWRADWRHARSSSFALVGAAAVSGGNEAAKLKLRADGLFDLELWLPEALLGRAEYAFKAGNNRVVHAAALRGLHFNRGHQAVVEALAAGQPLTFRFVRNQKGWLVHVTIDEALARPQDFGWELGVLGVDFNVGHVAATLADRFGNPVRTWTIPCVTYGKSQDQALDVVRKAAAEVAAIARAHGVPVVSEKLDFQKKKDALTLDVSARYARMLSSFAYASFDSALASACARSSVRLARVNPAFTSLIGRVKFAPRYGLSVHAAAALSIARRAMGMSERMPAPVGGNISVPLDGGGHVTLPAPARMRERHVWSAWSVLNRGFKKAAHAARGRAGTPRSLVHGAVQTSPIPAKRQAFQASRPPGLRGPCPLGTAKPGQGLAPVAAMAKAMPPQVVRSGLAPAGQSA